jgi:hypothetical protein
MHAPIIGKRQNTAAVGGVSRAARHHATAAPVPGNFLLAQNTQDRTAPQEVWP